ncbi:protealysin inhibitor emfourin [Erwinia aphidicola]|jgi:hypothetical protein|uniref:Protealysin inhibitor emfourin n=1 Tax=Erwinia aphidicola TaxID=68334 RepID=A0ABU8DFB9_ERWAP|nr:MULTISPECIES: protealysin inhibitor emfourin [Erwinia]KMV71857.1 hypothetical protein AI28_10700 [bacteria symbiont BFo1 of Frankliniella occidentalis]PIJ59757.1 hypothetical protein BOM23_03130 [Erwinia sp. OLMDLW33]VTT28698.1 Uncharacterised protein [Klebsiella pneumoniae]KYP85677.1 hypothetical protein WB66_05660 [bacteria symbiont BFo1 of Frankliniella occidentalis]KYP91291.1 hypothetical protein WB91_04985 [bacteria symbiont BFo1 of Frankliniella occidentalis]
MKQPELSDDAIIDVAREGGFALIPKLAEPRRFALSQLAAAQKERVCEVMRQALPLGEPEDHQAALGRGDQRYFRIQISYSTQQSAGAIVILIPEQLAPPELESLWRDG